MSDTPWIRFFPSDWLAGTRGMSAAETGVYITLVAMMYEAKTPIRDDEARLSRLCGLPPASFRKIRGTLLSDGKITSEDGFIWNRRVASELGIRDEKTEAARRSANSRWLKNTVKSNRDTCERIADADRSQCYPDIRYQKEEDISLRSISAQAPEREREILTSGFPSNAFDEWWATYPHKVGKDDARKKFEAVRKAGRATFTDLMEGVARYKASKPLDRAWCNPATWLNQGRWQDQPALDLGGSSGPNVPRHGGSALADALAAQVARPPRTRYGGEN